MSRPSGLGRVGRLTSPISSPVSSLTSTSPITLVGPLTSADGGHLWLVLGGEGRQCLVPIAVGLGRVGRHGGHGDLLGGQIDLVCCFEYALVTILSERHVTKMAMMLTRRLIDQRAMVAASQQQPSNLVVFVQMSLII